MDLATLTLSERDKELVLSRHASAGTKTGARIHRAVEAIEAGLQVVDLREVVRRAFSNGWSSMGREYPTIAVLPASHAGKTIRFRADMGNATFYTGPTRFVGWSMSFSSVNQWLSTRRASAPTTPIPDGIEWNRNDLYLQEVQWNKRPDPDPAILEPIGGWLYRVKATWDLTPLELSALS